MEQIIEYRKGYEEYKQELDTELRKTTEGFVRIGYLLKVAKDTDVLKESGYANVYEFAQAEYNIDKSQVSRFININDRFSEGGYSDRLKAQFQGFGHAKLTIMLQLPDEINAELSPEFTKSEIQAIREEYDAEQAVTDLEVLMEGEDQAQKTMDNNLYKAFHQLGKDEPELYVKLYEAMAAGLADVYETLAPNEEQIYSVRIMGVGRMMLSIKGLDRPVTLTNMRSGEKEEYSWEDVMCILRVFMAAGETAEETWEHTYNEEFPKKAEVAPVQPIPTKPAPKKEPPKKESKVKKAKKPEPKPKDLEKEPEEQIEGQDNIMNHPEYLPEEMQKATESLNEEVISEAEPAAVETETLENVTEQAEIVDKIPLEEVEELINPKSEGDFTKVIAGYKAGITSSINRLENLAKEGRWESLITAAKDIQWRAEQIVKLAGGQNG